jgi:Ca2+-binding RTX toxin-like protein
MTTINGTPGNDTITGTTGPDVINGLDGSDILIGGGGNDTLNGGAGDDFLIGQAGTNTYDGGSGTDAVQFNTAPTPTGVTIDLSVSGPQNTGMGLDTFLSIENIFGSDLNDHLKGTSGDNMLVGGGGDDVLEGGAGNDTLNGGGGNDTASYASATSGVVVDLALTNTSVPTGHDTGGAGVDTLIFIENLIGSNYNDTLGSWLYTSNLSGGGGDDTLIPNGTTLILDGGSGSDTLDVSQYSGLTIDLSSGHFQLGGVIDWTFISIENLLGDNGADHFTGDSGDNVLWGKGGDDVLHGGDGNDILDGGAGNDILDGGAGNDTASYADATSLVIVNLSNIGAHGTEGAGIDTLISIENLIGSNYNDLLTASSSGSTLNGGLGNDDLISGSGNDTLIGGGGDDTADYSMATSGVTVSLALTGAQNTGGAGVDTLVGIGNLTGSAFADHLTGDDGPNGLFGGAGDDVLSGGGGNDLLIGGAGNDTLNGGAGINDAYYAASTSNLKVNTATGVVTGADVGTDHLTNIQIVTGGSGNDNFVAGLGAHVFVGGAGVDTLELSKGPGDYTITSDGQGDYIVSAPGVAIGLMGVEQIKYDATGTTVTLANVTSGTNDNGQASLFFSTLTVSTAPAASYVETRAGTQDGSAATNDVLTGADGHNTFFFQLAASTGADEITNFGKTDVIATDSPLSDGNGDGIIKLGYNGLLNLDGSEIGDSVKIDGISNAGLRLMGQDNGVFVYADASVRPQGAVESHIGSETLTGDAGDAKSQTFFYDTALGLNLGSDTIKDFGAKDILVTTTAFSDGNGDGVITDSAKVFHLSAPVDGSSSSDGPGSIAMYDASNTEIDSLKYDGVVSHDGVNYYVYSGAHATAGLSDLHFSA